MTTPLLLIAEREFRTYVSTASFWVALAAGPLAMAGVVALTSTPPATASARISIDAPTPAAYADAAATLREAAALDGRSVYVLPRGDLHGAARMTIAQSGGREAVPEFSGTDVPLGPAARMLVMRTLERDAALARLGEKAPAAAAPSSVPRVAASPAVVRFLLMMILWLTLTGSLGMLLQAVVRERANRALENLLAAVAPADVIAGKVIGVGTVSALVLGAWLLAGSLLAPQAGGYGTALVATLGDPLGLARAALIYVLAFGFYGLVTVALGAGARDTAQAQNLSRPMFAVLLGAFFAAMASAGGGLGWLVYLPPFTPFMLLVAPPGSVDPAAQAVALGLLGLAALAAGRIAIRRLDLAPAPIRLRPA